MPEYLTRRTVPVFITLTNFLLQRYVSRNLLVRLEYFKKKFSFISACLIVSVSSTCKFPFLQAFNFYLEMIFRFLLLFFFPILIIHLNNASMLITFLYFCFIFVLFLWEFPSFSRVLQTACRPNTLGGYFFSCKSVNL